MLANMKESSDAESASPQEFAHKKSLGQNFLTSDIVPRWLCDAAELTAGETILEIGPGTGMLTRELLARGVTVVAVEADARAITYLEEAFKEAILSGKLSLHHSDARELDLAKLGLTDHNFTVVANIPYYLSGFLLRRLLETPVQPKTLVFLMQKELVARIARDKKASLLSLSVRAFGEPVYVKTVTRGHFNPPPKVDSAILAVRGISRDRLFEVGAEFFFKLLHLGLGSKRKQLIANLSNTFPRQDVAAALATLSVSPTVRGEDLSLSEWVRLATILKNRL